jgi:hypothetical protein
VPERSTGTGTVPRSSVMAVAERVWQYRLANDVFLRLRRGLLVTHLRSESVEDREADAAFARDMIEDLDRARPDASDADHLTAGFLRWLLRTWIEAARYHWLGLGVTPYNCFALTDDPAG